MNPYGVLAHAAARWQRLRTRLPSAGPGVPDEAGVDDAVLLHALDELRDAPAGSERRDAAARRAAERLALLLPGGAPAPDGGTGGGRFAEVPSAEQEFEGFRADDLAVLVLDGHGMVGPVLGPVRERLLAADSLTADELALGAAGRPATGEPADDTADGLAGGEPAHGTADGPGTGQPSHGTACAPVADVPADRSSLAPDVDPASGGATADGPSRGGRADGGGESPVRSAAGERPGDRRGDRPGDRRGDRRGDRSGGQEPDPRLIRLRGRRGEPRWPAFQFEGGLGPPLPVVLTVNELLDAERDPWGAADWWLAGNAWLEGEIPARLAGTAHDPRLVDAARFLLEDV